MLGGHRKFSEAEFLIIFYERLLMIILKSTDYYCFWGENNEIIFPPRLKDQQTLKISNPKRNKKRENIQIHGSSSSSVVAKT